MIEAMIDYRSLFLDMLRKEGLNQSSRLDKRVIMPLYKTIEKILDEKDPVFARTVACMLSSVIFTPPFFYQAGYYFGDSILKKIKGTYDVNHIKLDEAIKKIYGHYDRLVYDGRANPKGGVKCNSRLFYRDENKMLDFVTEFTSRKETIIVSCHFPTSFIL